MPAIGIQADKRHIDRLFEQLDLDAYPSPNPNPNPIPIPNPSPNPNPKTLTRLFEQFDLDGGGTVNLEELKAALRQKILKKGGEKV